MKLRFYISFLILLFFLSSAIQAQSLHSKLTWAHIANFHSGEFDCTCGASGFDVMDLAFVRKLDFARDIAGVRFIIVSAYRTKSHNTAVGGALYSSHVSGFAADIHCIDDETRFKIVHALITAGFTRIGIYPTHIHVDSDPGKKPGVLWRQ